MISDISSRVAGIATRVAAIAGSASPAPPGEFGAILEAATTSSPSNPATVPTHAGVWSGASIPGTIGAMLAQQVPQPLLSELPEATTSAAPSIGVLSGDAADRRATLAPAFAAAGARYGIDPALLEAVAWSESNFDATAVSPAGAIGLMQIMPATAAELGVDPTDPVQAIDGAARYLRQQLDRFGSVELALAAYNAGPGAVQQHGGVPPYPETTAYVAIVTSRFESLQGITP